MLFGGAPQHPENPEAPEPQGALNEAPPEATDLDRVLADPVIRWRAAQLVKAGLNTRQARKLALDNRVDLHFVVHRLLERGCDPDVAFDIAS
jgi:hypothetical protein